VREFYAEAVLSADTQVVAGDVILLSDGRYFLTMNKAPESFKNAVCSFDGVFYKCNVVGKLWRASQAVVNYETVTTWTLAGSSVRALQVESAGNTLEPRTDIGVIVRETHDLYIQHLAGIREHDRWDISAVTFVSKNPTTRTTDATKSILAGWAPVDDTWTVTFLSPSSYSVAGAATGAVGTQTISSVLSNRYFSIPAAFFTGAWAAGNTYVFQTAAEFYQVTEIKTRRFPGVDMAQLENDTR
jgi:hypothetical protein